MHRQSSAEANLFPDSRHGDKVHHRGIDWSSLLLRPDSPEYLPLPTLRPEDGNIVTIEPVIGELMRSSSLQENNADAGIYANKYTYDIDLKETY